MKFNAGTIGRIIRGLIGLVLVIVSTTNQSWIGLPGVLLIFSAISGRCGFGAASCEIKSDEQSDEKNN